MPKCLNCNENESRYISPHGWVSCLPCVTRQAKYLKPKEAVEMVDGNTLEDRQAYKEDILQPWRDDKLSKNYIKAHGIKSIQATEQEIDEAMSKPDVWGHDYYND